MTFPTVYGMQYEGKKQKTTDLAQRLGTSRSTCFVGAGTPNARFPDGTLSACTSSLTRSHRAVYAATSNTAGVTFSSCLRSGSSSLTFAGELRQDGLYQWQWKLHGQQKTGRASIKYRSKDAEINGVHTRLKMQNIVKTMCGDTVES
eukprot:scaffold24257_cov18-Tisochrysis_lutea.AAC.1